MENASRALIIAGGLLLTLLIIGTSVFLYSKIRRSQDAQITEKERQQIVEFNERFEAYNRTTVRGFQMISLSNLVYDTNARYRDTDGYVNVKVYVKNLTTETIDDSSIEVTAQGVNLVDYIQKKYEGMSSDQKNALKQSYFQCTGVKYDYKNSRVYEMTFERVNVVN